MLLYIGKSLSHYKKTALLCYLKPVGSLPGTS